jgi:hypothetical protein
MAPMRKQSEPIAWDFATLIGRQSQPPQDFGDFRRPAPRTIFRPAVRKAPRSFRRIANLQFAGPGQPTRLEFN